MRCENCGADNLERSSFCRECAAPLKGAAAPEEAPEEPVVEAAAVADGGDADHAAVPVSTTFARALSIAWMRRGPILMSLAIVPMMAMVFAPWAFIRVEVLGLSLVSRSFSGWDIIVTRVLFFLLIIPLVISLMMVAGIGTRRRVVETHVVTFVLGFMFVVWGAAFGLSQLLKSIIKNLKVVQVIPAGAQVATLIFLLFLVLGIILTSYDRGRQLLMMDQGG